MISSEASSQSYLSLSELCEEKITSESKEQERKVHAKPAVPGHLNEPEVCQNFK
jgi:hypothetical protein